jgi:tetratricopeptide (TPR) repeat protein
VIHAVTGHKLLVQGRLSEARASCERALASYDPQAHAGHRQRFGQDVEVLALGTLGMLYALQGHCDDALEIAERAVLRAESLKSPYNVCMAKACLAGTLHYLGDRRRTGEVAAALYDDAERQGIVDWLPIASILGAWARGSIEDAEREAERLTQIGNRYSGPYWNFTIAQSEHAAGRYGAALARCERALASSEELGSLYYVPELQRLGAECLASLAASLEGKEDPAPAWESARAAFEAAIRSARQQGAKLPELRATLGLARLPEVRSCRADNLQRLASIVNWFNDKSVCLVGELEIARGLLAHEPNHRGQHYERTTRS